MIARAFDPIAELQSAFNVLTKNVTLAAIPLIAGIIIFVAIVLAGLATGASAIIASGFNTPGAWAGALSGAAVALGIGFFVAMLVGTVSHAAVIASAETAWEGGAPDISAGVSRALSRVGDLLLFGIVMAILLVVIGWTFIGAIALFYLMIYAAPAIVLNRESTFTAMGTSWRMSTQNFGPTAAAFIGIVVFWVVGMIINMILGHIPLIGPIIGLIVSAIVAAFAALVTVRFYDLLQGRATPVAAVAAASYSAPPSTQSAPSAPPSPSTPPAPYSPPPSSPPTTPYSPPPSSPPPST